MKSGNSTRSQSYDEEDMSRNSTDNDSGTPPLYEDGEEEEDELWRQMAFAQESSKVTSCTFSMNTDHRPTAAYVLYTAYRFNF